VEREDHDVPALVHDRDGTLGGLDAYHHATAPPVELDQAVFRAEDALDALHGFVGRLEGDDAAVAIPAPQRDRGRSDEGDGTVPGGIHRLGRRSGKPTPCGFRGRLRRGDELDLAWLEAEDLEQLV